MATVRRKCCCTCCCEPCLCTKCIQVVFSGSPAKSAPVYGIPNLTGTFVLNPRTYTTSTGPTISTFWAYEDPIYYSGTYPNTVPFLVTLKIRATIVRTPTTCKFFLFAELHLNNEDPPFWYFFRYSSNITPNPAQFCLDEGETITVYTDSQGIGLTGSADVSFVNCSLGASSCGCDTCCIQYSVEVTAADLNYISVGSTRTLTRIDCRWATGSVGEIYATSAGWILKLTYSTSGAFAKYYINLGTGTCPATGTYTVNALNYIPQTGTSLTVVVTTSCNCDSCCDDIEVTVAGFTGSCGTYLNNDYILNKQTNCLWTDGGTPSKLTLQRTASGFAVYAESASGLIATSQNIPVSSNCPQPGTYTITFPVGSGDCSNLSGTVTIACSDVLP